MADRTETPPQSAQGQSQHVNQFELIAMDDEDITITEGKEADQKILLSNLPRIFDGTASILKKLKTCKRSLVCCGILLPVILSLALGAMYLTFMNNKPIEDWAPLELEAPINWNVGFFAGLGDKETILSREHGSSLFGSSDGRNIFINKQNFFVCKLKVDKYCSSSSIADNIEGMLAVLPINTINQDKQLDFYELHLLYIEYLKSFGIKSAAIEAIIPEKGQKFLVTSPGKEPYEMQIIVEDTLYYRENLVNVVAHKLIDLWEYLLWIDGHQIFENSYWWEETIYKAEHFATVQMFTAFTRLDQFNRTDRNAPRYAQEYIHTYNQPLSWDQHYLAGNAWGMRKEIYKKIGNIIDKCVTGGCDHLYMSTILEENEWSIKPTNPYFWQFVPTVRELAKTIRTGKASTIRGRLIHIYHSRYYAYHYGVVCLNKAKFDAERDLYRDENLTLHLYPNHKYKKCFSKED